MDYQITKEIRIHHEDATTQMEKEGHLKNWHKDTPNAPVMPYNNLIHTET